MKRLPARKRHMACLVRRASALRLVWCFLSNVGSFDAPLEQSDYVHGGRMFNSEAWCYGGMSVNSVAFSIFELSAKSRAMWSRHEAGGRVDTESKEFEPPV